MICLRHVVLALATLTAGCSRQGAPASEAAALQTPPELVGRWVRLREDSTWGDTLQYLADGRVLGSVGHSVPAEARWGVRAGPAGTREFCAADAKDAYCQTYRWEDSTLVLGGGPSGPSYFRRTR